MATLHKGLFGPISGKVGNMVFVTRNGRTHVQSLPKPSNKPASAAQIAQRTRFGMAVKFLNPLKPLVQESFKGYKPEATGLNSLVKAVLRDAITGDYPNQWIDYSRVKISTGRLASVYRADMELAGNGKLKLDWAVETGHNSFADDELIIVLYRESVDQFWFDLDLRISRSEGSRTIRIPATFSHRETHVWIAFRSAGRRQRHYSESRYMGTLFNKSNR